MTQIKIKRALLSVSNKDGLVAFAKALKDLGVELISTGGTAHVLRDAGLPVKDVSEVTGFPEIMDGRVKTLHPHVHGAILGRRGQDDSVALAHGFEWIDLVVVNLYPFADVVSQPNTTFDDAIENIDIGGPTMIRAAAKNMAHVAVVVSPNDYGLIIGELTDLGLIDVGTRKALAIKAFQHTSDYDALIQQYLSATKESVEAPPRFSFTLSKALDLRYGENPHQKAYAYQMADAPKGVLSAIVHQGKMLSYNNLVDVDAAILAVSEFNQPACVIVKHANPCGVACGRTITDAFKRAYETDSTSAFGGIIALNQLCDEETATHITELFCEVVIAPQYTEAARNRFLLKPNVRVLEYTPSKKSTASWSYQWIQGAVLMQSSTTPPLTSDALRVVTKAQLSSDLFDDLLFAWHVVKHVKSNAIVIAKNHQALGIGGGQVSRIDAVDIAIKKAQDRSEGAVLASDAFFPFRDSIDSIAKTDIKAIIQPGGSTRDAEVISACNEYGIAMVFTDERCFKH